MNNHFLKLFWMPNFGGGFRDAPSNTKLPNESNKSNVPVLKFTIRGNKKRKNLKEILNEQGWDHERRRGRRITKFSQSGENHNVGGNLSVIPEKGDVVHIY
jgi:hypothetical protein